MSTRRRALVIPALAGALLLVACGGDNGGSTGTTAVASTTVPTSAATTARPVTTAPTTVVATTRPSSPTPTPRPPTTAPIVPSSEAAPATTEERLPGAPNEIIIQVGVDDAATVGSRVEPVKLGEQVVLRLFSEQPEEYHVHGYELEQAVDAGVEAQFDFTADRAGTFEVESHRGHTVLVVLEVS